MGPQDSRQHINSADILGSGTKLVLVFTLELCIFGVHWAMTVEDSPAPGYSSMFLGTLVIPKII